MLMLSAYFIIINIRELLRERRLGAGLIADVGNRQFIVLTGQVDLRLIKLWVSQLYGDPQNENLAIVILSMTSDGEYLKNNVFILLKN